jgi:hypothetical protein
MALSPNGEDLFLLRPHAHCDMLQIDRALADVGLF